MRITIYQPRYFPQLHYFNRMVNTDAFVFLDDAQYTKSLRQKTIDGEKRVKSFQSDTPIKHAEGIYYLTVPVCHNGYTPLNKTRIDNTQHWTMKHLSVIKFAYRHALSFAPVYEQLKVLLSVPYATIADLNVATTIWALSYLYNLGISSTSISIDAINKKLEGQSKIRLKKIFQGGKLGVKRPEGLQKGTEWTTAICLKLGATEYFHGGTAQENYMDLKYYTAHGITPILQEWQCQEYQQQFRRKTPFVPNLSIIDLLFNVEKEYAAHIIAAPML